MSLKAVFKFENLDSTRDLNSTREYLFKKGVYEGGSIIAGTNSITIKSFRAMSYDGMAIEVEDDADYTMAIDSGFTGYVCVYAKYVYDDEPIIEIKAVTTEVYNNLGDIGNYYIILAGITNVGGSVSINLKVRDEISPVGRNSYLGYFNVNESPSTSLLRSGDWWFAGNSSTTLVDLCIVDSNGSIQTFPNTTSISNDLSKHRSNLDTTVIRGMPTEPTDKTKGAYHINYNELRAMQGSTNEIPSDANKFITEDDPRLVTVSQKEALSGNTSGGIPSSSNPFVLYNTPIATHSLTNSVAISNGIITLDSSILGSGVYVYVGTGIAGTANQYMEIASSDGSLQYDNDGNVVLIKGVYTDQACTIELVPATNTNIKSGYWKTNEPLYIKTTTVDGNVPALTSTYINIYTNGKLGDISGEATADRIYKQGYRQFSYITFDIAKQDNLTISENQIKLNKSNSAENYTMSLSYTGLTGSHTTSHDSYSYSITPANIKAYYSNSTGISYHFDYEIGNLSISYMEAYKNATFKVETNSDDIPYVEFNYVSRNSNPGTYDTKIINGSITSSYTYYNTSYSYTIAPSTGLTVTSPGSIVSNLSSGELGLTNPGGSTKINGNYIKLSNSTAYGVWNDETISLTNTTTGRTLNGSVNSNNLIMTYEPSDKSTAYTGDYFNYVQLAKDPTGRGGGVLDLYRSTQLINDGSGRIVSRISLSNNGDDVSSPSISMKYLDGHGNGNTFSAGSGTLSIAKSTGGTILGTIQLSAAVNTDKYQCSITGYDVTTGIRYSGRYNLFTSRSTSSTNPYGSELLLQNNNNAIYSNNVLTSVLNSVSLISVSASSASTNMLIFNNGSGNTLSGNFAIGYDYDTGYYKVASSSAITITYGSTTASLINNSIALNYNDADFNPDNSGFRVTNSNIDNNYSILTIRKLILNTPNFALNADPAKIALIKYTNNNGVASGTEPFSVDISSGMSVMSVDTITNNNSASVTKLLNDAPGTINSVSFSLSPAYLAMIANGTSTNLFIPVNTGVETAYYLNCISINTNVGTFKPLWKKV